MKTKENETHLLKETVALKCLVRGVMDPLKASNIHDVEPLVVEHQIMAEVGDNLKG